MMSHSTIGFPSQFLPHLALLLTTPSKAGLFNFSEPLFVLGADVLHPPALQELVLLRLLALLQDLILRLQLGAHSAVAGALEARTSSTTAASLEKHGTTKGG